MGKNWFDNFICEKDKRQVKEVFKKLLKKDGEPLEYFENAVLARSGKEKIIAWHNVVLIDEKNTVIGTLSSGEDITEKKIAQKQLQEKMRQLEIFHKTAVGRELKMKELKQRIKELEAKQGK